MSELDALLAPRRTSRPGSLTAMVNNLAPLIEIVAVAIADPEGTFALRMQEATPEERSQINKLRFVIDELIGPLELRRKALDNAARIASQKTGANEFPVAGGQPIKLSQPDVPYVVESEQLRAALIDLIDEGVITKAEIDEVFIQEITYRIDNRKLNYLRDHRGEKVAAAIAKHRHKPPVDPSRMKVSWPKPEDD